MLKSVVVGALALAFVVTTAQAQVSPERIKAITAMSPEQMAATGAFTRSSYDRMMGYVNSIKDPKVRTMVADMVTNPRSTVFNQSAHKNAYRFSPAAGGPGHHFYPGGLAVHAVENIEISLAWHEAIAKIHGTDNTNRDMIIAALVLHDWAKVWYLWDEATGTVKRPDWFPEYWGGADGIAKWKWMGGHGAIVYAEMMKRGAPDNLTIATAASHFDAYWEVDKASGKEGLNAALAEAAKLANVPIIKVDPAKRMAEWFAIVYSDGAWSYSHYIAGQFAHNWVREVGQTLGIDPKSPEANKLANFVLTRLSDFRLYNLYQSANFDPAVPKKLILEVIRDSSAYEVPG